MMLKTCFFLALFVLLLTSCSSYNQLLDNKSSGVAIAAEKTVERVTFLSNPNMEGSFKFTSDKHADLSAPPAEVSAANSVTGTIVRVSASVLENMMPLQFKYAIIMNETVEKVSNILLYQTIDQWFGTRYRFGGSTHKGIDCSAFMQVLSSCAFGLLLPRTAREQYQLMQNVNREDLHEGDFVFFNTRGGVSHVGMYLSNNKFVHSSTSNGVAISDLDETYWSNRILAFKRPKEELF